MRGYLSLLKTAFRRSCAYRTDVFFGPVASLIVIYVLSSFWEAAYGNVPQVRTITQQEMVTYALISTFMSMLLATQGERFLRFQIRTGEIALELVRPTNLPLRILAGSLGETLATLIIKIIPALFVGAFAFEILPPQGDFLIFLISLFFSYCLIFCLDLLNGLTCFWLMDTGGVNALRNHLIYLFSGAIVPLWFFPGFLRQISRWLPFEKIYFLPISIYLGRKAASEIIFVLLQQFLWIILLSLLVCLIWSRAMKKVLVQGG